MEILTTSFIHLSSFLDKSAQKRNFREEKKKVRAREREKIFWGGKREGENET